VSTRSKAWLFGRSLAGIVGSNPTRGMNVCLISTLRFVRLRSLRQANHSTRGVLRSVVCLRRSLHEATLHATRQPVQSPASERAGSKLAMNTARRNEKAGQSANSGLVHHSTPQRLTEELWRSITRYLLAVSITMSEFTKGKLY
jgi:hypothetical protein